MGLGIPIRVSGRGWGLGARVRVRVMLQVTCSSIDLMVAEHSSMVTWPVRWGRSSGSSRPYSLFTLALALALALTWPVRGVAMSQRTLSIWPEILKVGMWCRLLFLTW